jgi:hypothetical protein
MDIVSERMRRVHMADIMGIIVCIALVVGMFVVFCRTSLQIEKVGWKNIDNYDERQILSRGKAFQAGFFVAICSCLAFAILTSIVETLKIYATNFLFISAFAGVTVFAVISIWTDSFGTEKFQAKGYFALYFMIGAVNLVAWIMGRDWNTAAEFLASDNLVGFLIGVSFITIAVMIAIKTALDKREEN